MVIHRIPLYEKKVIENRTLHGVLSSWSKTRLERDWLRYQPVTGH